MFLRKDNFILNEGYENNFHLNKGIGQYIFSKKKKFYDLSYASGTLILGHSSKIFKNSLKNIDKNNLSLFSFPNIYTKLYTRKLKKINKFSEKFVFCNSGTEAVYKALRIARAITKKEKIVSVTGSWHGSVDKLLLKKENNVIKTLSDGVGKFDKKNTIIINYNDIEVSKKILDKNKNNISCVIIEPIQASLPNTNSISYLKFLSKYCKNNKLILIFDEIITGLRTPEGNVQNLYNLKPDITILGKSFGGGFPLGIIGVNKLIIKKIKKNNLKIFFGGTFSANTFVSYLGYNITNYIWKNRKAIIGKQIKLSKKFEEELNLFLESNHIDIKVYRFYGMCRVVFSRKKILNRTQRDFLEAKKNIKIEKFKSFLLKNKILYPKNGIIFFSHANTIKDINYFIENFKKGFNRFF